MADRGRDLKIAVLSDVDKFDLSKPADDLETLGKEAKGASDHIDKASDDIKGSAKKIDGAFDAIARSSRSNLRKVDDDVDVAKKGMDNFKDEAGQSGREAAASFSGGFSDVGDFVQETLANGLAGLGPVGAAAGVAAAAGLGFMMSKLQEANERIKDVKDNYTQMLADPDTSSLDKVKDFFSFLSDSGADLKGLKDVLGASGISLKEYVKAATEGGPALERVLSVLKNTGNEASGLAGFWSSNVRGSQAAYDAASQYAEGVSQATDEQKIMNDTLGKGARATEDYVSAIQDVADDSDSMASAIEDAATRQAKATKNAEDSWTDYKDTAKASIDDVIKKQQAQIEAAANFEKNTKKVFDRLGQDAVDWALAQGENADKAMQLLVNAPLKKGQQVAANYKALGVKAGTAVGDGIKGSQDDVVAAAQAIHTKVKDALGKTIYIPTGVAPPPMRGAGSASAAEEAARRRIQPVKIPTYIDVGNYRGIP